MQKQSLNGIWQLYQSGTEKAISATVPGCVHTDLLANNLIPDPFYRDQELEQFWIGETDWQYQRVFTVDDALLAHEQVLLRCAGLDTLATLTLNDTLIAKTDNMFRSYEFDIKSLLKAGENKLVIDFAAPFTFAKKMDAERGEMAGWVEPMRINSGAWIRKEPCNFGWDWGPKTVTSGIWRDIELVAFNTARLTDIHVLQTHDNGKVSLSVDISTEHISTKPLTANVSLGLDGTNLIELELSVDADKTSIELDVPDPQLWWLNNMGEQPLYDLRVTLKDDDLELGTISKRIGLRTLELVTEPDEWGESFEFRCNGVPFFAKGANWIPASPYPGSTEKDSYEMLIKAAVDANMNMLRVWGGGIYEEDVFYDLCDEMGIAIWQDFIFACGTYPSFDEDFMANVREEVTDNVKRLRDHACIALWCGNNEIEQGMPGDDWKASMSWEDYERLFDELIADIVKELAPHSSYWPGSPHSPCGDREDWGNQTCGDTHLWDVWHGKAPFEWYRGRQDRFCSEFGFQSFPEPETVYEFTIPEDRNITSFVMEHHQRSGIGNSTIIHYLLDWFRLPTSFENTIWLSQILQGMAMKYAVEHWRRNMPRTMGTLYWQHNDMWGVASWASLDWKGNWKALHHMARRFYAPILLSGVEDMNTNMVEMHLTSDLLKHMNATLSWTVTDLQGKTLLRDERAVVTPINDAICVHSIDLSDIVAEHSGRGILTWLSLEVEGKIISSDLVLLSRPKHMMLLQPEIDVRVDKNDDNLHTVTLTSSIPALYTWLELPGAKFSDNFFHLQPDVPHTLRVTGGNIADLQVQSLYDTYQ